MSRKSEPKDKEGRYSYEGLDRILHEKGRLAILTSLSTRPDGLLFNDLKQLTAMTDGNLSRHLDVLHEAELVEIWKGFEQKRPQTLVRFTTSGRRRFVEYLKELERVIRDARDQEANARSHGSAKPAGDWVPA